MDKQKITSSYIPTVQGYRILLPPRALSNLSPLGLVRVTKAFGANIIPVGFTIPRCLSLRERLSSPQASVVTYPLYPFGVYHLSQRGLVTKGQGDLYYRIILPTLRVGSIRYPHFVWVTNTVGKGIADNTVRHSAIDNPPSTREELPTSQTKKLKQILNFMKNKLSPPQSDFTEVSLGASPKPRHPRRGSNPILLPPRGVTKAFGDKAKGPFGGSNSEVSHISQRGLVTKGPSALSYPNDVRVRVTKSYGAWSRQRGGKAGLFGVSVSGTQSNGLQHTEKKKAWLNYNWFYSKNANKNMGKFKTSYSKITEIKLISIGLASANRIRQWAEKTLPSGKVVGEVINAETLHYKTFKPIKGGLFCERIFGPTKDHECACGKKFYIKNYLKSSDNNNLTKLPLSNAQVQIKQAEAVSPSLTQIIPVGGSNIPVGDNTTGKPFRASPEGALSRNIVPVRSSGWKGLDTPTEVSDTLNKSLQKRYFCRVCDVEYTYSTIRRTQLGFIKLATPVTHVWFVKGVPSYMSILLDMKKKDLQQVIYNYGTLTLENALKGKQLISVKPADLYAKWAKVAKVSSSRLTPQTSGTPVGGNRLELQGKKSPSTAILPFTGGGYSKAIGENLGSDNQTEIPKDKYLIYKQNKILYYTKKSQKNLSLTDQIKMDLNILSRCKQNKTKLSNKISRNPAWGCLEARNSVVTNPKGLAGSIPPNREGENSLERLLSTKSLQKRVGWYKILQNVLKKQLQVKRYFDYPHAHIPLRGISKPKGCYKLNNQFSLWEIHSKKSNIASFLFPQITKTITLVSTKSLSGGIKTKTEFQQTNYRNNRHPLSPNLIRDKVFGFYKSNLFWIRKKLFDLEYIFLDTKKFLFAKPLPLPLYVLLRPSASPNPSGLISTSQPELRPVVYVAHTKCGQQIGGTNSSGAWRGTGTKIPAIAPVRVNSKKTKLFLFLFDSSVEKAWQLFYKLCLISSKNNKSFKSLNFLKFGFQYKKFFKTNILKSFAFKKIVKLFLGAVPSPNRNSVVIRVPPTALSNLSPYKILKGLVRVTEAFTGGAWSIKTFFEKQTDNLALILLLNLKIHFIYTFIKFKIKNKDNFNKQISITNTKVCKNGKGYVKEAVSKWTGAIKKRVYIYVLNKTSPDTQIPLVVNLTPPQPLVTGTLFRLGLLRAVGGNYGSSPFHGWFPTISIRTGKLQNLKVFMLCSALGAKMHTISLLNSNLVYPVSQVLSQESKNAKLTQKFWYVALFESYKEKTIYKLYSSLRKKFHYLERSLLTLRQGEEVSGRAQGFSVVTPSGYLSAFGPKPILTYPLYPFGVYHLSQRGLVTKSQRGLVSIGDTVTEAYGDNLGIVKPSALALSFIKKSLLDFLLLKSRKNFYAYNKTLYKYSKNLVGWSLPTPSQGRLPYSVGFPSQSSGKKGLTGLPPDTKCRVRETFENINITIQTSLQPDLICLKTYWALYPYGMYSKGITMASLDILTLVTNTVGELRTAPVSLRLRVKEGLVQNPFKIHALKIFKNNLFPWLINNLYCLSHRYVWEEDQENSWRRLTLYFYPPKSFNIKVIPLYKNRNYDEYFNFDLIENIFFSSSNHKRLIFNNQQVLQNGISGGMNIYTTFSGAGMIQKLLNEYNFNELKKIDKQNRILLFEFNKHVKTLKKIMDPRSLKSRAEYYKACHVRDVSIRRTKAVRKIFNKATPATFETNGLNMILTVLPVLPPDLRPIVKTDGKQATADLNTFYKNIIYRNERLKKFLKDPALNSSFEMKYAQRLVQEAVDNLIQNGKGGITPLKDARGRLLKSLSDALKGKQGRFRQYLLGKRVDYSARSVIVVGPRLKLHECGIPKEIALALYFPFLIKRILNQKYALTVPGAKGLIQKKSPLIWQLLREIMKTIPVLLNRAPTLHRLGFQAFQPKLVEGKAILLHPLVCPAFNADFDGDQMAVHVPITHEAKTEAWKLMLARNNLLSPATGEPLILPSQDMVLGCYYLTTNCAEKFTNIKRGTGFYFHNIHEVLKAYNLQLIDLHAIIWVNLNEMTLNSANQEQPLEIRIQIFKYKLPLKGGTTSSVISSTRTEHPYNTNLSLFNYKALILYSKLHQVLDFKLSVLKPPGILTQCVRTTPGKILFNTIIQNALNKRPILLNKKVSRYHQRLALNKYVPDTPNGSRFLLTGKP